MNLAVYEGIKPTLLFVSQHFEAYSPDNENDLVSDFGDLDFEGKQIKQAKLDLCWRIFPLVVCNWRKYKHRAVIGQTWKLPNM